MNEAEIVLTAGWHESREDGMCSIEALRCIAGLDHGIELPPFVHPAFEYLYEINDAPWWRNDAHRTGVLLPYLPRMLDTAGVDSRRLAYAAADVAVRLIGPRHLRVSTGEEGEAVTLESLSPIVDLKSAKAAERAVMMVEEDAIADISCVARAVKQAVLVSRRKPNFRFVSAAKAMREAADAAYDTAARAGHVVWQRWKRRTCKKRWKVRQEAETEQYEHCIRLLLEWLLAACEAP